MALKFIPRRCYLVRFVTEDGEEYACWHCSNMRSVKNMIDQTLDKYLADTKEHLLLPPINIEISDLRQ